MRWLPLVWVLLATSVAAAQPAGDEERARAHFTSATSYYADGEWEAALREFTRAHALSHRPELLYNIYLCHERLGNLAEAIDHLERFLAAGTEVPDREHVTARLEAMRERLAQRSREGGETAGPARSVERAEGGGVPAGAWVSFAVAAAGAVTWGVFGALTISEDSEVASSCGIDAGRTCSYDQLSSLRTYALVADIGGAAALAFGVTGLLILVLSGGDDDEPPVTASASPLLDGAMLSVRGDF